MKHLSLRAKSLLALTLACLVVLVPAGILSWQAIENVRTYFGQDYARTLTLLNRQKILEPLAIDLALSRRLAESAITRDWLRAETDPDLRERFFREAEGYRGDLHDQTYFVASAASGKYYLADGTSMPERARYQLDPGDPVDRWFYATLANPTPYNININPDPRLKRLSVWINARITDGADQLGVLGASINLTEFLQTLAGTDEPGIMPMVIDAHGAIQAHPDLDRIAYNSGAVLAQADTGNTLFRHVAPADLAALQDTLARARDNPDAVMPATARLDGIEQRLAIAYVPQFDWYVVTALDLQTVRLLSPQWLWLAGGGLLLAFALLLTVIGLAVERTVLRPVRRLQVSARAMADGRYDFDLPASRQDEIGELSRVFGLMATKVRSHTDELESRVRERTTQLEQANQAMVSAQKKVSDSIDYASLLQRAILPQRQLTQSLGGQHFVIWQPRDVVGGDFYVFRAHGENCLLGIMDCAGHGVPGALMTMLMHASVDLAIREVGVDDPAAILARCDQALRGMLDDTHSSTGLATNTDAALVYIDRTAGLARYAGARIGLYSSHGGELEYHEGGRRALGDRRPGHFENRELPLPGRTFYLVTDGFLDQAGGSKGYGFGDARLIALLKRYAGLPLAEQAAAFVRELAEYQGDHPQRDDITMLSFRFE